MSAMAPQWASFADPKLPTGNARPASQNTAYTLNDSSNSRFVFGARGTWLAIACAATSA